MTTDGGGFMLIGRKNTSVTWTVPSNDNTVEPFGDPHWISSLGNAPVMDFRVQVATQENFKSTKAHWLVIPWVMIWQNARETARLTVHTEDG